MLLEFLDAEGRISLPSAGTFVNAVEHVETRLGLGPPDMIALALRQRIGPIRASHPHASEKRR
jgi:hypothetical protein